LVEVTHYEKKPPCLIYDIFVLTKPFIVSDEKRYDQVSEPFMHCKKCLVETTYVHCKTERADSAPNEQISPKRA